MKNILPAFMAFLTLLTSSFFTGSLTAAEEKSGPTVTTHIEYAGKYLVNSGINLWDKPVLQGITTINWSSGMYALLWASTDMEGKFGDTLADELDWGIGWAGKIHGYDVDIGVTYFDAIHLNQLGTFGANDTIYTHLKVGKEVWNGWKLALMYENYETTSPTDFEGGNLFTVEVSRYKELSKRVHLSTCVAAVYDDGGYGLDTGWMIRPSLGLDFDLGNDLTLNLAVRGYFPIDREGIEEEIFPVIGFTKKW